MRTSLESLSSTALALAGILARCHAQSDDGPHDVPATEDFLRRLGSRACVIGDYIYFDGGELSERGFNVTGHLTNAANATLSIDLSTSWSPADVEINEIPRPSDNIPLNRQSILKQESKDTFYVWGGGASHGQTLQDPPVLWKFEADGRGGGSWSEESDLSNRGRFEQLDRTFGAAYASTPDKGFVFGGVSHKESAPSPVPSVAGHVAFDFDSKAWSREARAPYTSDGGLFGGTATFVPGFGPNGIILILGGVSGENEDEYPSFRRLHFMDPVTGQWFAQETSGDVPDERATHCSVGVQGHNGTYEIFVYGGEIRSSQATKRDVHALSLPGFRWTRAPDTGSTERRDHACAVVGGRHMLSWGGLNSTGGAHGHWSRQDPLPQGIGLFDMAAMRWVERYDADAAKYETHEDIMAWYETGGMRTVDWASDEVEALFAARESSEPVGGGGGSESGNDGGNDGSDGGSEDGGGDSVSTGTIVGAVVGGVGGLALIGGLAWFLLRRRRRGAATSTHAAPASAELSEAHAPPKAYGDQAYGDQTYGGHAYAGQQYAQAPSAPPVEAPGPVTSELTADSPPVEMADTSRARW